MSEIDLELMYEKDTGKEFHRSLPSEYSEWLEKKLTEELNQNKENERLKIWNVNPPKANTSVICRMNNSYIKMCHWTGTEWLDNWEIGRGVDGEVKEWMHIPYDKLENKEDE